MRCWLSAHLAWVSAGGVGLSITVYLMLRRALYSCTLRQLDAARDRLLVQSQRERGTFATGLPDDKIIKESGAWPWLARLALKWEYDKKKGRL